MIERKAAKMLGRSVEGATLVAAVSILGMFATACSPTCGNEQMSSLSSNNSELIAYKFNRNCGATTSDNVQIAIVAANSSDPEAVGNIFVADGTGVEKIENPLGSVTLSWTGNNSLVVTYDRRLNIFKKESAFEGVKVSYKEM